MSLTMKAKKDYVDNIVVILEKKQNHCSILVQQR